MRTKRTGTGTEIGTGTVIVTTDIETREDETHIETNVDVLALVTDVPHRLPVLCQKMSQHKRLHQRMKSLRPKEQSLKLGKRKEKLRKPLSRQKQRQWL
jgi:hypothetical protein